MNCHYVVVREDYIDEVNARTAYGIAAVKEYDGCPVVMQTISDVYATRTPVMRLVRYCNEMGLELIHLRDVVDDLLVMLS
ncbi:MAG: hypothetical protein IJC15_06400 [Clostridia bacterium]|nr:hypothetical protein [Clostridia bacterium]